MSNFPNDLFIPGIVIFLTVVLLLSLWVRYASSQWVSRLQRFREKHHQYCTTLSSQSTVDVLFIVSPASGGGKPMTMYQDVLEELKRQGNQVEVYVTGGSQDMITLSEKVNLARYTQKIVFLGGDSSLFEFVQQPLQKNHGSWPYAPILILPGGSGNALSSEFHFRSADPIEIIQKAVFVRKGSVIKVSSNNGTIRYALHNAFDGYQRRIIDVMESTRGNLYAAFGKPAVFLVMLYTMIGFMFQNPEELKPIIFCIMTSEFEGMGANLNFGVTRFDHKMIVMHQETYKGVLKLLHIIGKTMSGMLGKEFQDGIVSDKDFYVDVRRHIVLDGGGHYCIYMDGSNNLSVEGYHISFETLPDVVPYLVM